MPKTWLTQRITVDPDQFAGKACIRGLRIRVVDILDALAAGDSPDEILEALPDLEPGDIPAALAYAAMLAGRPASIAAE